MKSVLARLSLFAAALTACNVTPASTTGGVDLPGRGDCPRGVAVVSSDFVSSEIALLSPAGDVKSAAFLSSAGARASSLAAPLSGDISVATAPSHPGELVIVDRFGTDVLTFVDTRTVQVRAQLPIGTGFEANPQTYLELDEHRALVPRLGENPDPGREPFDAGSDVLVVDPSVPVVVGSVSMPRQPGYRPNPAAVMRAGDVALVTLQHARPDYGGMADSELVALDVTDLSISYRLPLTGLKDCGRAELSPSGAVLAVACSSFVDRRGAVAEPSSSGLILLDAETQPPQELERFAALELASAPLQADVAFFDERRLLFKTQTALGADSDNQLYSLDLDSGEVRLLATAARGAAGLGYGVAFGGLSCGPRCGDPCLVADASRGKLLRFDVRAGELEAAPDVRLGGAGLPPVSLVPFY